VKESIRGHINRFPAYESHYGRSSGDPTRKYLSSDLTLSKMYTLFIEECRAEGMEECEDWLDRDIFNTEFPNLSIMKLKSDTCDTCDRFSARIKDATADEVVEFQRDLYFHQLLGKYIQLTPNQYGLKHQYV
jgi:hypothetical protein